MSALRPFALLPLVAALGCATLAGRSAVPKDVAMCRELSCQGVAALEAGDWQRAEQLLVQAIEASPADATSRRHLAEVLWNRRETHGALVQIEAAVRLDPNNAALAVRSGEMLLATGAVTKARRRAEQAMAADAGLASAWALRARTHWRENKTDRALADMQRALQFAPQSADVLLDLAALYRERGQHQRSLTTIHHLLDHHGSQSAPARALLLEGLAYGELGRWAEASVSLAEASRHQPTAETLFHLARAQAEAGQADAARNAAERALQADATHAPSRQLLARLVHAAHNGADPPR